MNNKPVLTEKQQRKTLSARKKPIKPALKNVLAQPLSRFWPEITDDETQKLIEQLKAVQTGMSDAEPLLRSEFIKIGLNACVGSLKKHVTDTFIISANIKPKHIVDQIILLSLSSNPNIKIVCAPRLETHLASLLTFKTCLCICLRNTVNDSRFHTFNETIKQMSGRFVIPQHMLNLRPAAPFVDSTTAMTELTKKILPTVAPINFEDLYVPKPIEGNGRGFVPAGSVIKRNAPNDWSDFIAFNKDECNVNKHQQGKTKFVGNKITKGAHKKKQHNHSKTMATSTTDSRNLFNYVTLSVHKVQSNPNKLKKKNKKERFRK